MNSDDLLNLSCKSNAAVPCLALRPREAARAIGVSERTLWDWTKRGLVPHVRLNKAILYPVDALRRWLDEQAGAAKMGSRHE